MAKTLNYHPNLDNYSCAQAALKMALEYLLPEQEWPYERVFAMSNRVETMATWEWPVYNALAALPGLTIQLIYPMDVYRFAAEGVSYLSELWTPDVMEWVAKNSDMTLGHRSAQEFVQNLEAKKVSYERRNYTLDDMRRLLDGGYILIPNVNLAILLDEDRYIGHSITVYDHDENGFIAHDPGGLYDDGSPQRQLPACHISNEAMQKAILLPGKDATESLLAIKRKT